MDVNWNVTASGVRKIGKRGNERSEKLSLNWLEQTKTSIKTPKSYGREKRATRKNAKNKTNDRVVDIIQMRKEKEYKNDRTQVGDPR